MKNNSPYMIFNIFEKLLKSSKILQNIQHNINVIIELNNIVNNLLPFEIRQVCRVVNYRNNVILIEVPTAVWLFRFNYEKKNIFFVLKKTILPSLSLINIKINPNLILKTKNTSINVIYNQKTKIIKTQKISTKTAKQLLMLAKKSPKCLKEKFERLAALAD
ncbi:Putative protein of unknown function (DUF721) family protein [Candidatus Providencia siddallii]|uniref:DUF721 domain-containing protein n=1 Tax=Candidatus Providencia siddallii TaxID=1715285 RepID=A0A0M6W6K2_9GAMM|nr:Putative protein of unknown function (DUF721) family protein [Candidatus Providencia siddallii]